MRPQNSYHGSKGFSTDTAKSLELWWVELLYVFVGHDVGLAFDLFLHPFLDSCKRSIHVDDFEQEGWVLDFVLGLGEALPQHSFLLA
jgi:hypothetical protein